MSFLQFDGAWNDITTYGVIEWYHLSIDFRCGVTVFRELAENKFKLSIYDEVIGVYSMRGDP